VRYIDFTVTHSRLAARWSSFRRKRLFFALSAQETDLALNRKMPRTS
jgi:hypothetical protein